MIPTPHPQFSPHLKTALLKRDVQLDDANLDDLAISMLPRASQQLDEALVQRLTDAQQREVMTDRMSPQASLASWRSALERCRPLPSGARHLSRLRTLFAASRSSEASMITLVRLLAMWIVCFALGILGGTAISAGISSIVNPLGASAAEFALRDDRVSADVRQVLASVAGRISTTDVGGGTAALAVSSDRSMVALGFSDVRPSRAPEGDHHIGLMLVCADDIVNLGLFADGFFTGSAGEGWENSVAINVPRSCTDLVITHLDARGELFEFAALPIRPTIQPNGDWAMGMAS